MHVARSAAEACFVKAVAPNKRIALVNFILEIGVNQIRDVNEVLPLRGSGSLYIYPSEVVVSSKVMRDTLIVLRIVVHPVHV